MPGERAAANTQYQLVALRIKFVRVFYVEFLARFGQCATNSQEKKMHFILH